MYSLNNADIFKNACFKIQPMLIQHNLLAMNAARQYNITTTNKAKSAEKLSSGYRINRAADDAASLTISETMRRQIRGLNQAADNIQDGISYVQVADGALEEVDEMLQRMNELAVQARNDTNSDEDRAAIDSEIQELKNELIRVFGTTSFNDRLIWEGDPEKKVQVGTKPEPTIRYNSGSRYIDTNNTNKEFLPYSGINLAADDTGVTASWTGYDGNVYTTSKIDWDTLESNGYSFKLDDYFPDTLKDSSGNPYFTHTIGFSPNSSSTREDIINAVNSTSISTSKSSSFNARFENASESVQSTPGVSVSITNSFYDASYVSSMNGTHTFEAADDPFIEPSPSNNLTTYPSASTVEEARTSNESWTFKFNMSGIGPVTASCTGGTYYAPSDVADDDEGYWWNWSGIYRNVNGRTVYDPHYQKTAIMRSTGNTLSDVMDALTGAKSTASPGLLTSANGGDADHGGTIRLNFSATADNQYSSGSVNGNRVFDFNININVSNTDTEETVFNRIKDALNGNTRLDVSTNSGNSEGVSIYAPSTGHRIDVPVYSYDGSMIDLEIQAGPERDNVIDITYKYLDIDVLGLKDTNVLTHEDAGNAIDEIKNALSIVNGERSGFGAYQNRLEHAYNNDRNIAENTQAAESLIRDTDMAREMVEFSKSNIISQFNESMIAQANQLPQQVLSLLS